MGTPLMMMISLSIIVEKVSLVADERYARAGNCFICVNIDIEQRYDFVRNLYSATELNSLVSAVY